MKEMSHRAPTPALSRPLAVSDIPPEGFEIEISTTEAERAALADLNDLPAISSLTASLRARRWRGEGMELEGEIRARLRQNCVVSLTEFETDIVAPLHIRFAPPEEPGRSRARGVASRDNGPADDHDPFGEDPPDQLIGGAVDLGAVISEFLTLSLDPYPRMPGAEFSEPAPNLERVSPFAALNRSAKQTEQE